MLHSYGSIYALGHKAVQNIFDGTEVEVTEKVDGSQISFGIIDGELMIRSKNQAIVGDLGNNMFRLGVEQIELRKDILQPGYIYRGEYLSKPKHNTLCYDRVPTGNIVIYDIERSQGSEDYLICHLRNTEAARIGFDYIPTFYAGPNINLDMVMKCLENDSYLGGVKIEGVVVKNYNLFTEDKKVAKAKFVSAEFKEKHVKDWGESNPGQKDIIQQIIESLRTEARWRKSVQHLRDDGRLEGSPRDIGNLIKEAQSDILKEEEDEIKETLYNHFRGQILRGSIRGLPEWYKEALAKGEIET